MSASCRLESDQGRSVADESHLPLPLSHSSDSNATNKARLEILQSRESHLQDLFEGARDRLSSLSQDSSKYGPLMTKLIVQGLLQLLEKKVTLTIREKDADVAKKSVDEAKKTYKEKSGRDVEIEVKRGLAKDSNGGVLLWGHAGKIKVDNTLDERLKLVEELVSVENGSGRVQTLCFSATPALTDPSHVLPIPLPDAARNPPGSLRSQPQQEVQYLIAGKRRCRAIH